MEVLETAESMFQHNVTIVAFSINRQFVCVSVFQLTQPLTISPSYNQEGA